MVEKDDKDSRPISCNFVQILDILNDGYGSIDITNLYFSIDNSKTL